jgi:hypothetical protein
MRGAGVGDGEGVCRYAECGEQLDERSSSNADSSNFGFHI